MAAPRPLVSQGPDGKDPPVGAPLRRAPCPIPIKLVLHGVPESVPVLALPQTIMETSWSRPLVWCVSATRWREWLPLGLMETEAGWHSRRRTTQGALEANAGEEQGPSPLPWMPMGVTPVHLSMLLFFPAYY